jgi:hypothetical protein
MVIGTDLSSVNNLVFDNIVICHWREYTKKLGMNHRMNDPIISWIISFPMMSNTSCDSRSRLSTNNGTAAFSIDSGRYFCYSFQMVNWIEHQKQQLNNEPADEKVMQ